MKILILGDCASAGTNVLTGDIIGNDDCVVEYSLSWRGQYHEQIIIWYMKKRKELKNLRPWIPAKDVKKFDGFFSDAIDFMHEQELANSYWKYINASVTNLSVNGATAGGYYKRLKKYELDHGRPDVIFVTDHTIDHKWQVVNLDGQKYFFEKNYDPRHPDFVYNDSLKAGEDAQRKAFEKAKRNHEKGNDVKRNKRIMSWFIKHLDSNGYNYHKLKMYDGFQEFNNGAVDCSDLVKKYTARESDYRGDIPKIKVEVQSEIAKRIVTAHPWLTNSTENV